MLKNLDFRHFWATVAFNSFSEPISAMAIPLTAALILHATPSQMGILVALQTLPFALFSLPVGVWLDRRAKFPILFCCEFLFPLALCMIPLIYWLGHLTMPLLYCVSFALGIGYVVGGSASQIFLTHLVGREHLMEAQSHFVVTESLARLIGPGIAGLLVQWLTAPVTLLVNGVLFLLSAWNLTFIKRRDSTPKSGDTHPFRELVDGLKFVRHHPVLWAMAWSTAIWQILCNGYMALSILFATRELHMTPGMLGAAQMLGGVGVLLSSLLLKPLTTRFGSGPMIILGIAGTALGWIILPLIPAHAFGSNWGSAALYGIAIFVFDCAVMLFIMPYVALRMQLTPDHMLGRMISTMRFLTVASAPIGAITGGWLGEHLTIRPALTIIAAGGVLLSLLVVFCSPLRTIRGK
jgi:MFS family permease